MWKNKISHSIIRLGLWFLVKRNPQIIPRLAPLEGKIFLLEAEDRGKKYYLLVQKKGLKLVSETNRYDVLIRGKWSALRGLLDQRFDADELFFGGHLQIEGDIEAATHLKNILSHL